MATTSFEQTRGRINWPHLIVAIGLLAVFAAQAFGPGPAQAKLPGEILVLKDRDDTQPPSFTEADFADKVITRDYTVKHRGKKAETWSLTGIPLLDILAARATDIDDFDNVPYVKLDWGDSTGNFLLFDRADLTDPEAPAMLVDKGVRPGGAPARTGLIRDQRNSGHLNGEEFDLSRLKSSTKFKVTAGKGSLLSVRIEQKRQKDGKVRLRAVVNPTPVGGTRYSWKIGNGTGAPTEGSGKTVTADIPKTRQTSYIVVSVEGVADGSTGVDSATIVKSMADDQKTTAPTPPASSTPPATTPSPNPITSPGATSGTGGQSDGSGASTVTGSTSSTSPSDTAIPTPSTGTPTIPTTEPTPVTAATADSSRVTDAAKEVKGGGALRTISGILLAAPSGTAPGGAPLQPLESLAAPVQALTNTIFKPIDDTRDLWPYLVALLLALCTSGAVREYQRP